MKSIKAELEAAIRAEMGEWFEFELVERDYGNMNIALMKGSAALVYRRILRDGSIDERTVDEVAKAFAQRIALIKGES